MIRLLRRKRSVEMVLSNIIGIVLAIIIIIATFYFFYRAGSIFFSEEGQKSKASLRRLGIAINDLELRQAKEIVFYLDKGYSLVGFSATSIGSSEGTKLPSRCMGKSCICVCENKVCGESSDYDCVTFQQQFVNVNYFETNEGIQNMYLCKSQNNILVQPVGPAYKDFAAFQDFCKSGMI